MTNQPCELCHEEMKRFATLMDEMSPPTIEVDGQVVKVEYGKLDIGILCWHGEE